MPHAFKALPILLLFSSLAMADGWGTTTATNIGSVANTRHNLTQSFIPNSGSAWMNPYRNNYGEVCVYCHTPHGSNTQMGAAPLWNRTKPPGPFTLYSARTTLDRPITQPGPNSLTCLSCHDGVTAIDSIINMPGSGRVNADQQTTVSTTFLDSWPNASSQHSALANGPGATTGCTYCHTNSSGFTESFEAFVIGNDLRNDHPIGVRYPESFTGIDFAVPSATNANNTMSYFDKNGSGRVDTNEIRLYNTGDGFEVECASCHDPHGVPEAGSGTLFIPSFLRVKNSGSALCLTCHTK